jgi:circadian clock protein KaiC
VDGGIAKAPTGIHGLDEITNGGLPQGRPTLVCGSAGCGKTLLAMEFLVRGALDYGEPGVFVAFEETAKELTENVRSLGFDLDKLIRQKKLFIDYVQFDRNDIQETGEYNLDGLFIRLADAIDTIGAKRIVLDTLETLFSGFENEAILRAELRRLFRWLKERGVTAVITAERGDGALTRQGLEEYVSDCVILLDHRVYDQLATRRLRVVKYRGTTHGTNEYPFLIESTGIEVIPITSVGLTHTASNERVSTGLAELDAMLGGRGLYRGSTVLVSGTAGTGKTSLGCQLAVAHCSRGERVLYFAFEESSSQIARNMRSIGLNLQRWMMNDLLRFHAVRPTTYGLEAHLAVMYKQIRDFKPRLVIIDPITNFISIAGAPEVKSMLMRLIDFMKQEAITSIFSSLTLGSSAMEATDVAVSSIVDTWLVVRDIELNGERNRALHILKSRGMHHSNQVREYRLTSRGIVLSEVYLGPEGSLLTGSARVAQEARETAAAIARRGEIRRKQRALERKRAALEAQIASMRSEFETESDELSLEISAGETREQQVARDREAMAESRSAVGSKVLQQPGLRRRSRHEELK